MKKNILKSLATFAVLEILLGFSALAEDTVYTISYSPGTLFHQLVRDRAKVMYERAGLKANFIALPHNRSLISANEGVVDGDVGRVPSVEEKYPNLVRIDIQLMDLKGAVYTIRPEIEVYEDGLLDSHRVGYVLGVRWPQKRMEGKKAITARDYPSLFEMLLQDRVDLLLATEASAESVMKELGDRADNIRKLQPFIFTAPIFHYVNKRHIDIVPQLEKALKDLVNEGYWTR